MTLAELLVTLAVIGILSASSIPIYSSVQVSARYAKAEADARAIATAVTLYETHMGRLPGTLHDLSFRLINPSGIPGGPYMTAIPPAPTGWIPYVYEAPTSGVFTIMTAGDGRSVIAP